jgi:hypothetical protein
LAICAITIRVADSKATVGLPANQAELIHRLLAAGKPVIMVGLGSPYLIATFPEAATWLAAFSVQDVAQRAAARALLGQVAIAGKLPVSIPGAAPRALHIGDGMTTASIPMRAVPASSDMESRLQPVTELLNRAIEQHKIRFASLAISQGGRIMQLHGGSPPPITLVRAGMEESSSNDYWWENFNVPLMNSLIARLVETRQLTLDTAVAKILGPSALQSPSEGWKDLTVRQLLEHTSGLELAPPAPEAKHSFPVSLRFASSEKPRDASAVVDISVTARIVEALTGFPAMEAGRSMVLGPLGARGVPRPSLRPSWERVDIIAENLLTLGQLWLNGGIYAHKRLFTRRTLDQFLATRSQDGSAFSAGWDFSTGPGDDFSPRAFGFTWRGGPSVWMDPERDLCVVFIPGNPSMTPQESPQDETGLNRVRAELHHAILNALGLASAK